MNTQKFIGIFTQLTPTQIRILQKLLVGQTDQEIAIEFKIAQSTVRKHVENICKAFELQKNIGKQYSKRTELVALFSKYKPELINPELEISQLTTQNLSPKNTNQIDWGEAPYDSIVYGRDRELSILREWIISDRCKLLALLGMGGIGKTALASKLTADIEREFDYVIWRSLREAPKITDILADLIKFLSHQQETNLPDSLNTIITKLIHYLRSSRCLIILDNVESILQEGNYVGKYLAGYEGYGDLFTRIGESEHQSCLFITSREKPTEISLLESSSTSYSLQLTGLNISAGQNIFTQQGSFYGSATEWQSVIDTYAGNPLALKFAALDIQEVFNGNLFDFVVHFLNQGQVIFKNIRELLDRQFQRLSELEKQIMYWFAINREPCSQPELKADIISSLPITDLIEAVASLKKRSLIEKISTDKFSLQNVVMEYITDKLIREASQEIQTQQINLLHSHALIKAHSKDYIREAQTRLIIQTLKDNLLTIYGQTLQDYLVGFLAKQRINFYRRPSYLGGNIINLLCQLSANLQGCDFSNLAIWQAYLKDTSLHSVDFSNADLSKSVFAETLSRILTVAFHPNGKVLATGDTNGEISLWSVINGQKITSWQAHKDWIRCVAFSSDGKLLASGSKDKTVRLWNLQEDVQSYDCRQTFKGHIDEIWSVVFSPTQFKLASGSNDRTVRIWNLETAECLILQQHSQQIQSISFSSDGRKLASGSEDQTIKIWDVDSGECQQTLTGHTGRIWSVAFHPHDLMLASSSDDLTIRIWDIQQGKCCQILTGHHGRIWSVAFSPTGKLLASGSGDETAKVWDTASWHLLQTMQEHNHRVRCVAFSPDERTLVSGCDTQMIKAWDIYTGKCLQTLRGYTSWVRTITFSPDGQNLVSGSNDQTVRLWNVQTGKCVMTMKGHRGWVRSVAFSPDSHKLASAGNDRQIRLWNTHTGQSLTVLSGHQDWVWWLAFSPNGDELFSCSEDRTIKIWHVDTGECLKTWQPQDSWIWSIALSPDGTTLAIGGDDYQVRLWNIKSEKCIHKLVGHSLRIQAVSFNHDGKIIASGSDDGNIIVWDVTTGQCLQQLVGHTRAIRSIAYSPDDEYVASGSDDQTIKIWNIRTAKYQLFSGHLGGIESIDFSSQAPIMASSSEDETIKIWDLQTGLCRKTLKMDRLYEGMNIKEASGFNKSQREVILTLGAIEF